MLFLVKSLNILVTSVSKKVPLIRCLRQSKENTGIVGKVIGGDANKDSIARYFVDQFWQMPIQELLTIDELLAFCTHHEIQAIIPTRDGELSFFAKHRDTLLNRGITCLISPLETVENCRNKILFYQKLADRNFPAIPAVKNPDELHCPSYVVKECFGSGSRSIGLDLSISKAKEWAKKMHSPIFQPFIRGIEYSVDVYIDKEGVSKGAIARRRELVVDGESQITISESLPEIELTCLKAAKMLGVYGHAVFQLIRDLTGHIHLIECNPRFGGGSTLSVAMGLNSFEWFMQESLQLPLSSFKRSKKEMKQVRYAEDKLIDPS